MMVKFRTPRIGKLLFFELMPPYIIEYKNIITHVYKSAIDITTDGGVVCFHTDTEPTAFSTNENSIVETSVA